MKKNLGILLLISFFLFNFNSSFAQHDTYQTSIGVRLGYTTGVSFKHFLNGKAAVEVIGSRRYFSRGILITGLYEIHAQAFDVDRLHWFYGGGAHVGSFNSLYYSTRSGSSFGTGRVFNFGVDAILGLEYHLSEIPITIAVDIKPFFDIYHAGSGYGDGALTVRYVLK